MTELRVDADLVEIAREIVAADRPRAGWAAIESDDMFRRAGYVGGFDADEDAFVFAHRGDEGELWFQFTLEEAVRIASGPSTSLPARSPDTRADGL